MATLQFEGDLTIYTAMQAKERLAAALAEGDDLAMDLAAVTEIDAAGLQLLLLARREVHAAGRDLRLVGSSDAVAEMLGRMRLDAVFPFSTADAGGGA